MSINIKNFIWNIYLLFFEPTVKSVRLCKYTVKSYSNGHKLLARSLRNYLLHKYGIHIGLNCLIGEGLKLPHPTGIVIGNRVQIGNDCTIYQHVTMGKKHGISNDNNEYPIIGDNVIVFAGAIIVGGVKVGDNSIIAPNSVVLSDIEANSTYAGTPARKIK